MSESGRYKPLQVWHFLENNSYFTVIKASKYFINIILFLFDVQSRPTKKKHTWLDSLLPTKGRIALQNKDGRYVLVCLPTSNGAYSIYNTTTKMATQFYYIYSYQKRGSNLRIMERGSPTRILLGKCKKLPIQSMLLIKSIFCDIQMNLSSKKENIQRSYNHSKTKSTERNEEKVWMTFWENRGPKKYNTGLVMYW